MYGLVLEGGGAKGSYHMGVYKALMESGIEIKGVAGTSIGALNGAMIVQNDYERCYDLWNEITYSMVVDVDDDEIDKIMQLKLVKEDLSFLREKIKNIISTKGFDITPLRKLLDEYIDEEKIRKSGMDFGIVTINLSPFKPLYVYLEDIPKGDLKEYLMASAYLPFFKSERLGGKLYLDGGFYDNLPFKMLIDRGYKDLILVRTHAMGFTKKLDLQGTNSIVISPSDSIGKSFEYDSNRARANIELGYYDGLRALNGLQGNRYYIVSEKDKDYYLNFLLSIPEEEVRKMEEILKLPEIPYRRSLLEHIIPKICSMLSVGKSCSYEELLVYLLEKKAEYFNIERFKIYTFEELLSEVEDKNIIRDKEETGKLDKLIEKVDILPILNKDEVLLDIADIMFSRRE
ncbi:patatin-like phospholipase family protein [Tissierella carlieri]|uniref:Patatin-like phospholipase family protein n=1 Tax=Tissierella carlieri TaxID=689904 RepID=A0ABT1S9Y2_9FIRM|nr:patatin-like phospholipase family protein [Tissierella carlieri]MBU5311427.1 patatin-like phospholipase family protein [Tissierella carlieri]MCQ4923275.1 patatin-like phospholipase family protein [Tissierella carlieri]